MSRLPRVVLLSGGVGGARFATGLLRAVEPEEVAIVANVGDDLDLLGLRICPDVDTLLYTLSGRADPEQGWGVAGDTREALAVIAELGGPDWFILGDRDIGLHLVRAERLAEGEPLSAIVADVARRMGIAAALVPATDDRLRTRVLDRRRRGRLPDVVRRGPGARRGCAACASRARPAPSPRRASWSALAAAERIVIAPSNVLISVEPILAVDGIRDALAARRADVVAVTPLIAGEAVKGPLADDARRPRRWSARRSAWRAASPTSAARSCSTARTPSWRPRSRPSTCASCSRKPSCSTTRHASTWPAPRSPDTIPMWRPRWTP